MYITYHHVTYTWTHMCLLYCCLLPWRPLLSTDSFLIRWSTISREIRKSRHWASAFEDDIQGRNKCGKTYYEDNLLLLLVICQHSCLHSACPKTEPLWRKVQPNNIHLWITLKIMKLESIRGSKTIFNENCMSEHANQRSCTHINLLWTVGIIIESKISQVILNTIIILLKFLHEIKHITYSAWVAVYCPRSFEKSNTTLL